jgi:hypothetical protein
MKKIKYEKSGCRKNHIIHHLKKNRNKKTISFLPIVQNKKMRKLC